MKPTVTIKGIEDVDRLLSEIAPNQALNIMRATIHGVAGTIAKDARDVMPVDSGDMKKATKHKRERTQFGRVSSTVRVAKKAFYWRFREYGRGPDGREDAMFAKAVAKFRAEFDRIFINEFGKKFEAALARARKRQG